MMLFATAKSSFSSSDRRPGVIRFVYSAILSAVLFSAAVTAEEAKELQTRVGIMDPEVNGGSAQLVSASVDALKKSFTAMGGYDVKTQHDIEEGFANIKQKFPKTCREPGCVAAIGEALSYNRMVFGTVDKGDKTYGVRFTLVDVETRAVVDHAEVEGDPGMPLENVIDAAVKRLHGQPLDSISKNYHVYYGREVHNKRELVVTDAVCLGAGAALSIANYAVKTGAHVAGINADYSGMKNDKLSGINAGADEIAMFARPGSMGECYVAASDDAYGIFFNPAGLSWVAGPEAAIGYQYLPGRGADQAGVSTTALSFVDKASRNVGFGNGIFYSGDHEGLYYEMYFVSGISYKINKLLPFMRPISVGADIKIMDSRTGGTSTGLDAVGGTSIGLNCDAGLKTELSDKICYALMFKNIPIYQRWENQSTGYSYVENQPTELIMGGTFQVNYATFLICEGYIPLYSDQPWKFAGGAERVFGSVFAIRAGAKREVRTDASWKLTAGVGLTVSRITFDASYQYNTLQSMAHVLNCTFRCRF